MLGAFSTKKPLPKVGIQLFTVRSEMAKNVPDTLARLAHIGYKEVEFAGYYDYKPQQIREMLVANGLTAPSTHVPLTAIESNSAQMFADANTMGHEWLTVPSLPQGQYDTVDAWKVVAERFNNAARQMKSAGLRFAYHNHNREFRPLGDTRPYDVLLENTDPALVSFEMDLYWVVNANMDPVAYLRKYPGRVKMFHVKDSSPAPEHKMMDVGSGTIDFPKMFEAGEPYIEHYFVERDDTTAPFATASASYQYLKDLRF